MQPELPTDFDAFASDYRSLHSANVRLSGADSAYFARFKAEQLQRYEKNETLRFLDLGCGDGLVDQYLEGLFPMWELDGIDPSATSIGVARSRSSSRTRYHVQETSELPFETAHFDIVMLASVLHHVAEHLQDSLIAEVLRVLRPGGRVYLFEHNPYNPVTRYFVRTCPFDVGVTLLTAKRSIRLFQRHGFEKTACRYLLFFPRARWLRWLLPLEKRLGWLPLGGQYMLQLIRR
jgi:SAM-dependent methyltransferase